MKNINKIWLTGFALCGVFSCLYGATADEYYFTKRNAANTANEQKTLSPIDAQLIGFSGTTVVGIAQTALPVSTATQTALDLKAPLASPTFTGTVSGITKTMVGLGSVDNTSDLSKPVSTATQTALDLKAPLASPTFTGTVSGITKTMVGLGSVDNTSDLGKPISTATQTALDLKAPLASPTFTGPVTLGMTSTATSGTVIGVAVVPTYNQTSGTAANTDLLVNRTQTAVGSGNQRLLDLQLNGTSQFRVVTNGNTVTGALLDIQDARLTRVSSTLLQIDPNLGVAGTSPVASTALALPVGSTSRASLRVPHGAAPTSPTNGDVWTTTSGLFARINGATSSFTGSNTGDQSPANPTASVGLTVVGGSATTFMRSDAAPALSVSITPTWTGGHNWSLVGGIGLGLTTIIPAGSSASSKAADFVVSSRSDNSESFLGAGATNSVGRLGGVSSVVNHQGSGAVGWSAAFSGEVNNAAGSVSSGTMTEVAVFRAVAHQVATGKTTSLYSGLKVNGGSSVSGTLTEWRGVNIETNTSAGSNWGIYDAGNPVYFGASPVSVAVVKVTSGSNARAGTFTLSSGAATVSNTSVTANSVVVVTVKTVSGTRAGNPDVVPTVSTGFVATGAATDNSTYNFIILEVN